LTVVTIPFVILIGSTRLPSSGGSADAATALD
jgi:hypothetical protein